MRPSRHTDALARGGILRSFSWRSWCRVGRGATAVEYLIALILCALVVLGISRLFGTTLFNKYRAGDERISEMGRSDKSYAGGAGESGTLVSSNGEGQGGKKGGNAKGGFIVDSRGRGFHDSSTESQLTAEEERKRSAAMMHARAQGYDVHSPEQSRRRTGASGESIDQSRMDREQYELRGEEVPEEFRFNPMILILIALILLGLGYMMVKGNKEEG